MEHHQSQSYVRQSPDQTESRGAAHFHLIFDDMIIHCSVAISPRSLFELRNHLLCQWFHVSSIVVFKAFIVEVASRDFFFPSLKEYKRHPRCVCTTSDWLLFSKTPDTRAAVSFWLLCKHIRMVIQQLFRLNTSPFFLPIPLITHTYTMRFSWMCSTQCSLDI